MVEHKIAAHAKAVEAASQKLADAKNRGLPNPIRLAESNLCSETRLLLTRYVNLVNWTGEVDKSTQAATKRALKLAVESVGESQSPVAFSICQQFEEFKSFIEEKQKQDAAPSQKKPPSPSAKTGRSR